MGLKEIKNTLIKLCGSKIIAYHATTNEYDFKDMKMPAHFGTYQASLDAIGQHGKVLKAYIDVKNPIRLEDDSIKDWGTSTVRGSLLYEYNIPEEEILKFEEEFGEEVGLVKLLQSRGYDSVVYMNEYEDAGNDSYIVFENSQVTPIKVITV